MDHNQFIFNLEDAKNSLANGGLTTTEAKKENWYMEQMNFARKGEAALCLYTRAL